MTTDPAIPRPRRRWPVVLVLGAVVAAATLVPGMLSALFSGTDSLRWAREDGTWAAVTVEQHNRRLWGPVDGFLSPTWTPVAPGLSTATMRFGRGPEPLDIELVLSRFDPASWRFRVWGRPDWTPGPVGTLAEEAGMVFAVNASYFADEGPLGLVISDGVRRNAQGTKRAAHFLVVDGRPRIVNERRAALRSATQGFQGFPSVMSGGRTFSYMREGGRGFHVRVAERRTAACTLRDGRLLVLVTAGRIAGLSFHELATVMGGLGCVDAMAFDGGSSTGMTLRWGATRIDVPNATDVPVVLGAEPVR
jgi:Phosphodiester glycosidase